VQFSKDSDGFFCFFSCQFFFCSILKKYTKCVLFQVLTKKILQLKKTKKAIWIFGDLHNFWCGDIEFVFLIIVCFLIGNCKKQEGKNKKNLKHPTKRKASSVRPIRKPLSQGSSLAPLRTTFDTWLPPDPLKPP
jgi:hypothetical protein